MSPVLIENGFLGLSVENITASQCFKPIRWYLEKTAAGPFSLAALSYRRGLRKQDGTYFSTVKTAVPIGLMIGELPPELPS